MKLIRLFYYTVYVFMLGFCPSLLSINIHDSGGFSISEHRCIIGATSDTSFIDIYLNCDYLMENKKAEIANEDITIYWLPLVVVGKHYKQIFWVSKVADAGLIKQDYSKFRFILRDNIYSYKFSMFQQSTANEYLHIPISRDGHHSDENVPPFSSDESQLELDYDEDSYSNLDITMNPSLIFDRISHMEFVDISGSGLNL